MRQLASLVLIGSSFLVGCAKNATSTDSAASTIDSSDAVESEGNMMMALTDGADQAVAAYTADQVAAKIAANVGTRWLSAGCATATASGPDVTVKLNDCTGPRGLLHVTGEIDLVGAVDAHGVLTVTGHSVDLMVNKATLSFDTTAVYGSTGTEHTLTVQTTGTGTGPLGNEIDHTGQYTITWDTATQCGSLDGMWSTEFSNATTSATRSNAVSVMRCAGGCPTGQIVHTGLAGVTLTVEFNGTNLASWSTSTGKSGTFNLACH